jgi:hypothetical protein
MELSFKQFLEFTDKPKGAAHFAAMDDVLGIDADAMQSMPQVSSFLKIGDGVMNLTPYTVEEIVPGSDGQTPKLLRIRLHPEWVKQTGAKLRAWIQRGGKWVEVKFHPDADGRATIRVDDDRKGQNDAEDAMTQGMNPADQAGGMGMGMPGMM